MSLGREVFLKKKKDVRVITLVIIFLFIFALWEFWGRAFLLGDKILVLAKSVEPNVEISYEMLKEKRVKEASKGAITLDGAKKIIGKESNQYIRGETELFSNYFSQGKLNANASAGTKIFAFPGNWLESYPQTLRRGDTVAIYSLRDKEGKGPITKARVSHVKDKNNEEIVSKDPERLGGAMSIETIEVVLTNEQILMLMGMVDYGTRFILIYE